MVDPVKMLYILSSVMVTTTMSMVISHIFFSMFFYIGFFLFVFFMPVIFAIAVTSMPSSLFFVIIIISGSWRSWWRIMPIKRYHYYFTNNSNLTFTHKKITPLGFRISKLKLSFFGKRQDCNVNCFYGRNSCFQCA